MTDTTQNPLEQQPLVIVKPEEISRAYELPDNKIAEIKAFCDSITITGVDDKANYKTASAALTKVKKYRTGIEAKRKELKEPFLEAGKAIDAEAKRLTALLTPIEEALSAKIKAIDNEAARLEQERRKQLHEQMLKAGYTLETGVYNVGRKFVAPQQVWDAKPEQLEAIIVDGLNEVARLEQEAKEREEQAKKIAELEAKIAEGKKAQGVVEEYPNEGTPFGSMKVYPNVTLVPDPDMKDNEVRVEMTTAPMKEMSNAFGTNTNDMFANIPPLHPNAPTEPSGPATNHTLVPPCTTTIFDYENGWNACREAVLKMMRSDVKLTRQQWIENVEQLTPIK